MNKFIKRICFFLVSTILLNSCATLFNGSTETVSFSSDPSGAKVYANGSLLGETPIQSKLKSKNSYTIEFKKDGYKTNIFLLGSYVGGVWIVLDIFNVVSLIIDAATGSWYELEQNQVNVVLKR